MKRNQWLIILGVTLLAGLRTDAAPLRLHFAGANAIQNHREALTLRDIARTQQGAPVFQLVARQLADTWATQLRVNSAAGTNRLAHAVAEILRSEIHFELASVDGRAWRLAAELPAGKAKSVQQTLKNIASGGKTVVEEKIDATGSWRFTSVATKQTTHISYQRGWLVIDSSGDTQPSKWRQALSREGKLSQPTGAIGSFSVTSELLETFVPRLQHRSPFDINLTTKVRKGTLRVEGNIQFQKAIKPDLEPFQFPTNTLRDPLISFIAARGIGALLAQQPELKQWRLPAFPNQLIAWTEADKPVYMTMALPLKGADRWFKKQIPRFEESLGLILEQKQMGTIKYQTNHHAAVWTGLPMIAPFLSPNSRDKDWLFSASFPGFLPQGVITNPPPQQLLSQVRNRPDLIYYHWEVTEPRVQQMKVITSLSGIMLFKRMPIAGNPMPYWINAIQDRLGNTITELTRVSDRQWKFVRSGTIGLTATELTTLAQWLTPSKPMPAVLAPPGVNRR